jgi:hypothetical protein
MEISVVPNFEKAEEFWEAWESCKEIMGIVLCEGIISDFWEGGGRIWTEGTGTDRHRQSKRQRGKRGSPKSSVALKRKIS